MDKDNNSFNLQAVDSEVNSSIVIQNDCSNLVRTCCGRLPWSRMSCVINLLGLEVGDRNVEGTAVF